MSQLGALNLAFLNQIYDAYGDKADEIIGKVGVLGPTSVQVQEQLEVINEERKEEIHDLKKDYKRAVKKYGVVDENRLQWRKPSSKKIPHKI